MLQYNIQEYKNCVVVVAVVVAVVVVVACVVVAVVVMICLYVNYLIVGTCGDSIKCCYSMNKSHQVIWNK